MPEGIAIEGRLARLETVAEAIERIERTLEKLGEKLETLHRLEQQQISHSTAIERAFKAIDKLSGVVDGQRADITGRLTGLEQDFAAQLGWAKGSLTTASTIFGIVQIALVAAGTYLFSHIAALEATVADLRKVDAVIEQRMVVMERTAPEPKAGRP